MRRPTVCIDCRYLRERPSGIATIVQSFVDFIPEAAPELDFLFLVHPKAKRPLSSAPNVREVVVPQEANGPATLFWLSRVVDLATVDVFHSPFNLLPHGLRAKTVVTICDLMWLIEPAWSRAPGAWGRLETLFYQHGIWNALRHATRLVAISESTRKDVGRFHPPAFERTRVVLEGVSNEFHPFDGEEGARELARVRETYVPGAKRYVLTVGQYSPYKNHDTVVRAFAQAFRDDPTVHLALVQRLGEGPKRLTPLARQLGVADRVRFLHGVPFSDLTKLYAGAMALCHPSLYEGFGNAPDEAIASGCPVVTSTRASMPEVSGVAALLVDPENVDEVAKALARVANEPGLAASMRERGLARAKELSWKACALGNLAVYRELVG